MTKILQDINLGLKLKAIRKSRGMTQEATCAKLGVMNRSMSQSNYSQIESGKKNIYVSDLIALSRIYNISLDSLFEGLEPISRYDIEK